MFTRRQIAELMMSQVYDHCVAVENRRLPIVEPEYDDEGTTERLHLDRWQDRQVPKDYPPPFPWNGLHRFKL